MVDDREETMGSIAAMRAASGKVGVLRIGGEYRLISMSPISAGDLVFSVAGVVNDVPTRYSVQVDVTSHVDLPDGCSPDEILDKFYWRFMNHSCAPNAA